MSSFKKIIGGRGHDWLYGHHGQDLLRGGRGHDHLFGRAGDDILVGGAGADTLRGGAGRDTFVYLRASDSNACRPDSILDFTQGEDRIDLGALRGAADLAWGGTKPTAGGVWFKLAPGGVHVLADTDGNLANGPELKIVLKKFSGELTARDFIGVSAGDSAPPVLTVDIVAASLNDAGRSSLVTFQFSESVTGFDGSDVSVAGGTLSGFAGSGASYSALFTAFDDAEAVGSVSVAAGSYTDLAGNPGGAGADTAGIDTHNPTLYELEFGDAKLDNGKNWTLISIKFSEDVSGFDLSDLVVTGGTLSEFTPLGGADFLVTFTADDGLQTTGSVSVAAGSYTDGAGNPGGGRSDTVEIDTAPVPPLVPVTLEITDDEPGVANIAGGEVVFTFAFSGAVTGFDQNAIEVSHGSADTFTRIDDATYTLVVIPEADFEGLLEVVVASFGASATREVDTRAPGAGVWIDDIETDTGASASDFITADTSPTLLGRHGPLDPGDKVEASSDGGLAWADATVLGGGNWSYDDPVVRGNGVVTYLARVVDGAGNVGNGASLDVTIQTAPPADIAFVFAEVTSPSIAASLPIATLSASPAGVYAFAIQSQSGSGEETFTIVPLAGGEVQLRTADGVPALGENTVYTVTVSVTDGLGNTSAETIGIYSGSSSGADVIVAADGRTDVVYAYGGNDTIAGGGGADTLFGGDGADTFDYNAVSDSPRGAGNRDVIVGFQPGVDRIDLSGIDANTATASDNAFVFVTAQTDEVQPHWLNWFQAGGNTYVQGDVDGNFTADFELQLAGNIELAAADFVL